MLAAPKDCVEIVQSLLDTEHAVSATSYSSQDCRGKEFAPSAVQTVHRVGVSVPTVDLQDWGRIEETDF